MLAGLLGLLAVLFYTQHRQVVWTPELVMVQGVASLPGFFLGRWLKKNVHTDSSDDDARFGDGA